MSNGKILEVCLNESHLKQLANNISSASQLGVKRFELCCNLHLGGLTPSVSAIECAVKNLKNNAELLVMIRPYNDQFEVDSQCHKIMREQIKYAAESGAHGVVFGAIKHQQVDEDITHSLVNTAKYFNLTVTFHRAFDTLESPIKALDSLTALNVDRILTSGTPWQSGRNAVDGQTQLNTLLVHANAKPEIVIGGGITLDSAPTLWQLINHHSAKASLHVHTCVHNSIGDIDIDAICSLLKKD
ncbi:copper homeostasis protein CutC [Pseudoalteromonas sp. PAB 2.2]|uniref:copper homeostasis protein CutC n=1 Tax=Pseudoalteromonas sp. PAB 2.2 TaxID=1841508 RepID=UPI0009500004|nr:copper homeostasis protein CutC [Pseudoalteromonas sp. PAB 2.2]